MRHDSSFDVPSFGDLLRRHRRAHGLTQEALAACAGVSARAISDLERGLRAHPYRETATLLAEALGLTGGDRAALLEAAHRPLPPDRWSTNASRDAGLPRPLTRLIGRDAERRQLGCLLREERIRLLSLIGPAGVGKTRLAVTVAADVADAFRDGVVYLDLSPLAEPSFVVPALAAALALEDRGNIPLREAVRRRLSSRQLLLVLDNFEHLLPAAPDLSDLLQAAPDVQALVTSRAALRLRGENEFPVAPLRTPDPHLAASSASLDTWEAVQLFVERASGMQPDFRLSDENAADVAAICRRLDGLPLAIELAAARVKLLTPATLLQRLERGFALLSSGMRDAPPRQQTLRAAIAWSFNLLRPDEQALLRCLAVFAGGWTLEAAETVGSCIGVPDALDLLTTLVMQNLVVREDTGPDPRFRLLETVREFASDQLIATGEEERARRAHLHYLMQLARANDVDRLDAQIWTRLARLRREDANLRAGVEWSLAHDPAPALELLAELGRYWLYADQLALGRDLYARVLATAAGGDQSARARVLQHAAGLARLSGDFERAQQYATALHAIAERLRDRQAAAHALKCEGAIAVSRGDVERAQLLLNEALRHFERANDVHGIRGCLMELGGAAHTRGDAVTAALYLERASAETIANDLPSLFRANDLKHLAMAYHQLGRREAAMEAAVAALRHARDSGALYTLALTRTTLARLLVDGGETAQAIARAAEVVESLRVFWENGNLSDLVQALELAAALMAAAGQAGPAARLLGAVNSQRAALHYAVPPADRETLSCLVADVRATLGVPAFKEAWAGGQARSLEQTVAEARATLAALVGA